MKTLCQDTRRLRVCFHVLQLIQYEIVIHDYYVKCKLRYGQYSKLRLHSASLVRGLPPTTDSEGEVICDIKVIHIPVSIMAFFCVCFRVSQGSKGKGKKWAKKHGTFSRVDPFQI